MVFDTNLIKLNRRKLFLAGLLLLLLFVLLNRLSRYGDFLDYSVVHAIPKTVSLIHFAGDIGQTRSSVSNSKDLQFFLVDLKAILTNQEAQLWLLSDATKQDRLLIEQPLTEEDMQRRLVGKSWKKEANSRFKGINVYVCKKEEREIAWLIYKGLLVVASDQFLVEEVLLVMQGEAENILTDPSLRNILQKQFDTPQTYINAPDFSPGNFDLKIIDPETFTWFRIEQNADSSLIGRVLPHSENHFFEAIANQANATGRISKILPANILSFTSVNLSNANAFFENINQEQADWFKVHFLPWIEGEMAWGSLPAMNSEGSPEYFWAIEFKDSSLVEESLQLFLEQSGQLSDLNVKTFAVDQVIEDNLFQPLSNASTVQLSNPFFTILENYVIFCSSWTAMELCLDHYLVNHTLGNDPGFLATQQEASDLNALVYLNPNFDENTKRILSSFYPQISEENLSHIMIKLDEEGVFELFLKSEHKAINSTALGWRYSLNNTLHTAPNCVQLSEDGPFNILFQDKKDYLYLLDQSGKLLWKRRVDGPVLSDFQMIDIYDSGAYQILFNTNSFVYLLNASGDEEGMFPFKLQSLANTGLTTIDFERNSQYSFFIPTQNGHIYGLDQYRQPISGWNPSAYVGKVIWPLQHFQDRGEDYLLAMTEDKALCVYQKNGDYHFDPLNLENECIFPPFFSKHEKKIVWLEKPNTIRLLSLEGQLMSRNLGKLSIDQAIVLNKENWITLSERTLTFFETSAKTFHQKWRIEMEVVPDQIFKVVLPNNEDTAIGILNKQAEKIYLLNQDGSVYPGFPLAGTSTFEIVDLLGDGRAILVVNNSDQIQTYMLDL